MKPVVKRTPFGLTWTLSMSIFPEGITASKFVSRGNHPFIRIPKHIFMNVVYTLNTQTHTFYLFHQQVILIIFSTVSPTYLKETLCSGWLSSTLIRNRDKLVPSLFIYLFIFYPHNEQKLLCGLWLFVYFHELLFWLK